MLEIEYIQVGYPNELLKQIHLIDTPGLASFYEDDSENAKRFLQLYGDRLNEVTQREATKADAVLYLFSHSLAAEDAHMLELFQGPSMGHISPINSLGVLTRVDAFSSHQVEDVLAGGQEIVTLLQNDHPYLLRLFYTITPVCGLLAWGAQTLTEAEFATLTALAALPESRLRRILRDASKFSHQEYEDVSASPCQREALLDRLGQYWGSGVPASSYVRVNTSANRSLNISLRSAVCQP